MSISRAPSNPFGAAAARPSSLGIDPSGIWEEDDDDSGDDDDDDGENDSDSDLLAEALPPAWDFFDVDAVKLRQKKANHQPIRVQRVRFQRVTAGNKKQGIEGEYDARVVNRAWALQKFGPGKFFVVGVNSRGHYVAGATIRLGGPVVVPIGATPSAEWEPMQNAGAPVMQTPGDANQQMSQQIIQAAVQRLMTDVRPAAPPMDPIRDAIAQSMKMMSLQMQMQMQAAAAAKPAGPDPLTMMLFKELIARRENPGGGMDEGIKFLTLGMQIAAGGKASDDGDDGPEPWMEILKTAVDRMGPGTVSLFSHAFLNVEQAKAVDDMIKHQTTVPTTGESE